MPDTRGLLLAANATLADMDAQDVHINALTTANGTLQAWHDQALLDEAALRAEIFALKNPPPVALPPVHVSGFEPPATVAGWTEVFFEDFKTPAAEGQFGGLYPRWGAYAKGWPDTKKNTVQAQYSGFDFCSVADDRLKVRLWTPASGFARVTALSPNLGAGILNHRMEFVWRVVSKGGTPVKGYHLIPGMEWPKDELWPAHGESDFCENDTGNPNDPLQIWYHRADVNGSKEQFLAKAKLGEGVWHRMVMERVAGKTMDYWIDGEHFQSTTMVPATPQRWVVQLESGVITPNTEVTVEFDWVKQWQK